MRQLAYFLRGRRRPAPTLPTPAEAQRAAAYWIAEAARLRAILDAPLRRRPTPVIVDYAPLPRTAPRDGILALLDCLPLMPTLNPGDALWSDWQAHAAEVLRHTLSMQPAHVRRALTQARMAGVTIRAALLITAPTAWQRDATRPSVERHLAAALSAALGLPVVIDHDQTRWRTASGGAVSGWDATLWNGAGTLEEAA
jgi:hypothetical protein